MVVWRTGVTSIIIALGALALSACGEQTRNAAAPTVVCSPDWFTRIESIVSSGDGQGHGPDPGSEEWRSTIEFRLGIRGLPEVPERMTDEWCQYIDAKIKASK